jgi:phage tail sheath protein FI
MGFSVSPSIDITEKDATTTAAAVSTTRGGIAGVFRWGPVEQRLNVSSEPDLVRQLGSPTDLNPETFFTAANFLAYGNSLDVVRVIEANNANTSLNTTSAYANTGAVTTAPVVKNVEDFGATSLDANVAFVAKYPGALGNSLRVSQCDSAAQYSSNVVVADANVTSAVLTFVPGSNSASLVIVDNNSTTANTAANTAASKFTVGDYVVAGNSSVGAQKMKVTAVGAATTTNATAASVTLSFSQPFTLTANYSANAMSTTDVVRSWEFADVVDRAPRASQYMKNLGLSVVDELHVVVVDEDGLFTNAPGTILEVFQGLSRATDAKTENQQTNYYKTVLNNGSAFVWVGSDRAGAASAASASLINSTATVPYAASLAAGQDGATEGQITLGRLALGYDKFKDPSESDVSIIMQGKARGVSADSTSTPSSSVVNYSTLANYILSNIAETRRDCIVCVSPAYADVLAPLADKATAVVQYLNNCNIASSYGFMDSGYKYQYDKYNDKFRWVPLNGDTAGCMVRTDFDRDPWFSPAGATRGAIKNVAKLAWNPDKSARNTLYKAGVNPVIIQNGAGAILYGDKTMIGRTSAFDRINVRRLFIVLEKSIANAAEFAMFEFNDHFTRNRFVSIVEPFLRDVKGRRGIYEFRVVCDETNNTDQVIDTNNFVGDIYIKPARSINFIQLNFVAVASAVEFDEIVGSI